METERTASAGRGQGKDAPGLIDEAAGDLVSLVLTSSLLPRASTVVDVRTRHTAHAVWWARERGARVVALHSDAGLADHLAESALRHGVGDQIEAVAASTASGVTMDVPSVDAVVAGRDVALVRIDSPAAALDALRGAEATLDRCGPLLLVEGVDDATLEPLAAWLEPRGYAVQATLRDTSSLLWAKPGSLVGVAEAILHQSVADGAARTDAEDLDPDRRALNAERAYERVRAEAIQYRSQRDRLAGRLSTSNAKLEAIRKRTVVRTADELGRVVRNPRAELGRLSQKYRGGDARGGKGPGPDLPESTPHGHPVEFAAPPATSSTPRDEIPALAPGPIRIAAIVDKFSEQGLKNECAFVNLHRETWREEIEEFAPTILLVESAWRGASNTWTNAVPKLPDDLVDLLGWCRERAIPTVFWNKEDPVHFSRFLKAAAEFDFILTTDIDLVPAYRAEVGHDRVGLMPFASQPTDHDPLSVAPRKHAAVFAGTYYRKYPERMKDFEAVVDGTSSVLPVEIFDRVYGTTHENFEFPQKYKDMIVGTLTPDELDVAYKRYDVALNMNTVKQSGSMVARRAFELLMSGTPTVSNWARGSLSVFGDIVAMSDDADGTAAQVRRLVTDDVFRERIRSLGLRKVLREHTYAERINLIESTVRGTPYRVRRPAVTAVLVVSSLAELETLHEAVSYQEGVDVAVLVASGSADVIGIARERGMDVWSPASEPNATVGDLVGHDHVAFLHPRHWYGTEYLLSLAIATPYAQGAHLTKHGYFDAGDTIRLRHAELCHTRRSGEPIDVFRSLLAVRNLGAVPLSELVQNGTVWGADSVGVDPFDFVNAGAGRPDASEYSARFGVQDTGTAIEDLIALSAPHQGAIESPALRAVARRSLPSTAPAGSGLVVSPVGDTLIELRRDAPGPDARLEFGGFVPLAGRTEGEALHIRFDSVGGLGLRLVVAWYDASEHLLGSDVIANRSQETLDAPSGAVAARLAIEASGDGSSVVTFVGIANAEPAGASG